MSCNNEVFSCYCWIKYVVYACICNCLVCCSYNLIETTSWRIAKPWPIRGDFDTFALCHSWLEWEKCSGICSFDVYCVNIFSVSSFWSIGCSNLYPNMQVQQQMIEVITHLASTAAKFPRKCVVLCLLGGYWYLLFWLEWTYELEFMKDLSWYLAFCLIEFFLHAFKSVGDLILALSLTGFIIPIWQV